MPSRPRTPARSTANLLELGGGDVTVTAGNNIDGGVYYVERGQGTLTAGNNILTNSTRAAVTLNAVIHLGGLAANHTFPGRR